jgi:hypothetical protein
VRVPEGKYTVKVTADTGPLAGVITGATKTSFTGLSHHGPPPVRTVDKVAGWVSTHQSQIVLGGVVVLVLGVVFTKMGRKTREVEFK